MPQEIEFPTYDGRFKLRGHTYLPTGGNPAPAVILSGGFADSAVRLQPMAEGLARAGLGVLLYEHRNTGASEGLPRLEIDPIAQIRDMAMAVTFAETVEGFDPNRIGLLGTSFSGGHVLALAASDRRVKAVVSCNPWISGYDVVTTMGGAGVLAAFGQMLNGERRKTLAGEPGTVVTLGRREDDPSQEFALFRDNAAMDYFEHGPMGVPPHWENRFTLRSLEYAVDYDVRPWAKRVSPTPLLMLVAIEDHTMPASLGLSFYEMALEPKELVILKGGHYDAYLPHRSQPQVIEAAVRWFTQHLAA